MISRWLKRERPHRREPINCKRTGEQAASKNAVLLAWVSTVEMIVDESIELLALWNVRVRPGESETDLKASHWTHHPYPKYRTSFCCCLAYCAAGSIPALPPHSPRSPRTDSGSGTRLASLVALSCTRSPRSSVASLCSSAPVMSGGGMRRSRESVQSYQQAHDDDDEEDIQDEDDEAEGGDEEDEEQDDEQQQHEEEDDEDEAEEDEDGDNEEEQQGDERDSVEQRQEEEEEGNGEDNEQYVENEEEDEGGLNDTKELEEAEEQSQQRQHAAASQRTPQPAAAAQPASLSTFAFAPLASSSTAATSFLPSTRTSLLSTTPFSFASSTSSTFPFPAFSASSASSSSSSSLSNLSTTAKPSTFGSTTAGSITPFSFSPGSSSASVPSSSSVPFPAAASSAAFSASSMPSFAFASTSSSISAPSSSSSFPSIVQLGATSSAATAVNRFAAASTNPSSTAASVSTTAAGTTISVPLSTSSVSAVWSPSDDLLFYPSDPTPATSLARSRNQQSAVPSAASQLCLFRWPPVYGETSTLLHAWHAVFTSTQRQAAERVASRQRAESMEWRLAVLSQSHCYRAELEACLYRAVQSLRSTAVASELKRAGVSESEYHSHLRVLESVSSTWHLFELLYLDPHDNLTVQLTDWMQRSYLAPSLDGLAVDSDEWWEAVLGLLVQGRLAAVVDALHAAEAQLLQFVSAGVWQQLLELIETLPSLTAHATSVAQLVSLVRDYRLAVQRLASSSAALMSHPFLPYLLAVLAGDEQAIGTICPTWMQLLVARLIFNQPHTTKADIPQLVTQCIQQIDEKDKSDAAASATAADKAAEGGKALDALREHVLCFRIHAAVLLADQMFDMPYFTAHLVDLLHHAALMPTLQHDADATGKGKAGKRNNNTAITQLPAADKLGSMTPRDHYVLQYVQSIIAHERLWTLTPEYVQSLATPAMRPIQALCTLLMKQPCSNYAQLGQLQAMAARLQLPALVGQQLALRLAHYMLRTGQIGSAVAVYQRAGEEGKERVRQIARKLLFALIKGHGEADGSTGELTTAMECVLDNVSEEWLDEEHGSVDILLLQHWADYTAISRNLHSPQHQAKQPAQPALLNVFQSDQASLLPQSVASAVPMEDGAEGEAAGGLLQDGVTLLASLLTAPLVAPSVDGAPVVYTPQCFHLPLLVRLCALLKRVEASGVGCELSAGTVRDVLHALSRCELSWRWEEWKTETGVSGAEVDGMRRMLLHWLQTTSTAEESAKRISVRV